MAEREQLQAELKKVSFAATQRKLDLHDLAEDLPIAWETILEVAQRTYDTYARVADLQAQLAALPKT